MPFMDVNSVLLWSHHIGVVDNVTDISVVHAASVFRVELCMVAEFLYICGLMEENMGVGWYGSFKGHRVYKNTISIHPFKCLPGITLGISVTDGFLVNSVALKRAISFL
jgi:hypothetical protein